MNERIKQLAEQCYEHDQSWTGVGRRIFNKEKFAELIVQDCIDIISPYTIRMSRTGGEYLHPILEIREHFGVE